MLTACSFTESADGNRSVAVELAPVQDELTMDDVRVALTALDAATNVRYEYYQRVDAASGGVAGSVEVPLVRAELVDGRSRLTAEMGVALDFGGDPNSRMNVLTSPERLCLNVPFYERVLDDSGTPPAFEWMIPLIDGWGCGDADRLGADASVLALFGLGDDDRFLAIAAPLADGRLVGVERLEHRGKPVRAATIEVQAGALIAASGRSTAADVPEPASDDPVIASVLIDSSGRVSAVDYTIELGDETVRQRLEVFDHDAVEPIELPVQFVDVSDELAELLGPSG